MESEKLKEQIFFLFVFAQDRSLKNKIGREIIYDQSRLCGSLAVGLLELLNFYIMVACLHNYKVLFWKGDFSSSFSISSDL